MRNILIPILLFVSFAYSNAQMSIVWEQQTNAYSYYNARVEKIQYDSEDNIIIAGYSWYGVYNSNQTVFVAKLSPTGEIMWLQRYMGEGVGVYDNGTVNGLFIDDEDNIILFAKYFSQKVIKYDKDGLLLSSDDYTFDLPFTINTYNNDILFDKVHKDESGYFIIGGIYADYSNIYSYFERFNPQGELWQSSLDTLNILEYKVGNSAITYYDYYKLFTIGGCRVGNYPNNTEGILFSYMNMNGTIDLTQPNWYTEYSRYVVNKMLRTNDGYSYISSVWSSINGSRPGSFVTKYTPDGTIFWEKFIDSVEVVDIELDSGGNIWVLADGTRSNVTLLAKYSAAGEQLVYKLSNESYLISELTINSDNDIYFVVNNKNGVFIEKHNWNGDKLDEIKISTNWNSTTTILNLDNNKDLIVCTDFNEKIYIKKISDNATDISYDNNVKKYSLSQNYPNPFNPSTKINFALPEKANVSLKVYNSIGEEVTELVNKELISGYHSVNFNATNLSSGIYFYRIIAGNFTQTNKMLLIK